MFRVEEMAHSGGTTITVHSGDYLEIPAGVPHQMTSVSAKFTFVVFKSRQ